MRRVFAVALLVVALAACGGDDDATETGGGSGSATGSAAAPNTVVLKDIKFVPAELTVAVGDTVTWVWDDGNIPHDVKFDDFRSKVQSKGRYEHTFDTAGSYDYTCSVHPQMDATIVVEEAAAGS